MRLPLWKASTELDVSIDVFWKAKPEKCLA